MDRGPDSRGTCVRVDLGKIAHNARVLKAMAGGGTHMMAIVKANAYGHGLVPVARTALENGAEYLGVAIPEEGLALRKAGIEAPVLVLGNASAAGAEISATAGLIQTVCDAAGVRRLESACAAAGCDAQAHLKLDTGMNRIGARNEEEVRQALGALADAPHVRLTGVFTHFSDAENPDDAFSREQLSRFESLCRLLPKGLTRHAAASEASRRFPDARLDMVREGIALYGYGNGAAELGLEPAMQLETRVAYVKTIHAGDSVGYGRAFRAQGELRVATLPVGYGDGYPRACSQKAMVLIHGALCPVLGNVCMDQMMVDVSRAGEVKEGDQAVLMGRQGERRITADHLAAWAGTISYEILLSWHVRVPVIYEQFGEGK